MTKIPMPSVQRRRVVPPSSATDASIQMARGPKERLKRPLAPFYLNLGNIWKIGFSICLAILLLTREPLPDYSKDVMPDDTIKHKDGLLLSNETLGTDNPWKAGLFKRLDRIRSVCGELCDINDLASFKAKSVDFEDPSKLTKIKANVDCNAIMKSDDIDAADSMVPYPPPDELLPLYTMNGAIELIELKRYQNVYLEANEIVWSEEMIETQITQAKAGTLLGTYSTKKIVPDFISDVRKYMDLENKSVLVIGSEKPWMESICLSLGARKVTTLEYSTIVSKHPRLKTFTPSAFREAYLKGTLEMFDAMFSFSSLEHSGLGRYGDVLNPWGDILAVARARCVIKSDGQMMLGVPTGPKDVTEFNAHRVYSKLRWPLLTANWENIDGFNGTRPKQSIVGRGTWHFFVNPVN